MIGQILTLILVLVIIPLCVGMIPVNLMEKRHRSLGVTYIAGFLSTLALFQIIAVPVVIIDGRGFKLIVTLFSLLTILLGAVGIFMTWRTSKKEKFSDEGELLAFLRVIKKEDGEMPIKKIRNNRRIK